MTQQKRWGAAVTAAAVIVIITLTLTPSRATIAPPPSLCIICGGFGGVDVILNVLLFVPLGIGLGLLAHRRRRAFMLALALSLTIEILQIPIPGRDSSLGDVVTNAAGATLGLLVVANWRALLVPDRRVARLLATCAAAAWWAMLLVSGWAVQTSLPTTTYWGQWEPELLQFDRFPGKLLDARVAGFAFPDGMMADSPEFRRRLLGDSAVVRARVLPAGPTRRTAPIVSVYDMYRTQVFLLGERGRSAIFTMRMHAADLRVRGPQVGLDGVFAPGGGRIAGELQLAAGVSADRRLWIEARGERTARRSVSLDVALGWSFLLPFDYAYGAEWPWLTGIWLVALASPVAYWARRDGRSTWVAASLATLVALAAVPPLVDAHASAWWEWGAVLAGLCIGAWIGRWTLHTEARRAAGELVRGRGREARSIATL